MNNYEIGRIYLGSGESKIAEKFLRKAVEENSNSANYWAAFGECLAVLGKYDNAKDALKKSLAIDSNQVKILLLLSQIYKELGEENKSVEYFMKAEEQNVAINEVYSIIGRFALNMNKLEEAEEYLKRALSLNPQNAKIYNTLALLARKSDIEQAIKLVKKALKLKPDSASFYFNLGNFYKIELKNYDEAIKYYEKSLELNSNSFTTWNNIGITYMGKGEYKKAEECILKSIEIAPVHFRAYYNLACLFSLQNKLDKALQYLEKSFELVPENICRKVPNDPDLHNLWEDYRVANLLSKYCGKEF